MPLNTKLEWILKDLVHTSNQEPAHLRLLTQVKEWG